MESWDINKNKNIITPVRVIFFLNAIDNICKKYNFSISHEDSHGSFILEKYNDYNIKWLKDCMLDLEED